jgi:hypothetical protein
MLEELSPEQKYSQEHSTLQRNTAFNRTAQQHLTTRHNSIQTHSTAIFNRTGLQHSTTQHSSIHAHSTTAYKMHYQ